MLSSEPALARRGARARTLGQPEFDVDNVGFKQTNLCFLWRFREIIQEEDTQTEQLITLNYFLLLYIRRNVVYRRFLVELDNVDM